MLAWRLGGVRCLAVLGAREGFPTARAIARKVQPIKFLMSHKGFNAADVNSNAKAMLVSGDVGPKILMLDEVACEAAMRYDDRCVPHGSL